MDLNDILLIIAILGILGLFIVLVKKGGKGELASDLAVLMDRLQQLNEQNRELRENMDRKLAETHAAGRDQFGKTVGLVQNVSAETQRAMNAIHEQSQRAIADVSERLAKLDETNKQVVNFSAQLQNLQDILKNPKQRGILGEYFLEQTLVNVLPPGSYAMQHKLGKDKKSGADLIVDAAVFVKDKIIPVDSKFSLENYEKLTATTDAAEREKLEKVFKQDLKNRIDETAKYIRPDLGTLEFAFMFIPSEAIYYDLLVNAVGAVKVNTRDLIEYAFGEKKVVIVSPTSFLAYLQTVLQGLRAMQIEENAKDIRAAVEALGKHIIVYEDYLKKMGGSLSTTVSHFNSAYHEFKKIDKDVVRIAGGEARVEPVMIEKPKNQ